MLTKLVAAYREYMILPLRLAIGVVFIMHGYSALSHGYTMSVTLGTVAPFLYLFGGLCLFFGFFTRYASAVMAVVTMFYLFTEHFGHGFFVKDGGYEYHLVLFAASITLMIAGSGRWSLEGKLGIKP
ncbi:MAG: DoxX family protein [Deltaproteobacteria bacterium]|nr:DoxX family protein [Deltaproteobacteria bacterium]